MACSSVKIDARVHYKQKTHLLNDVAFVMYSRQVA